MNKTPLGVWIVRFLFCISVILSFKMFDNFNIIVNYIGVLFKILTPFIIGAVIAFFLFPLCKKTESLILKTNKSFIKKHVRGTATLITYLCGLMIIIAALLIVIPMLYESTLQFVQAIPGYLVEVENYLNSHFNQSSIRDSIINYIASTFSINGLFSFLGSLDINGYVGGITNIIFSVFNVFIGMIISAYLLLDRSSIHLKMKRIGNITIKEKTTGRIEVLLKRISDVIYTFIFGQMVDALVIATIIGILTTLFGVKNSIILATVYFLFALIPYFGSITGVVFVILFSLVSTSIKQTIIAGIIALAMQQIDANLINPRIVGHAVGIRPLYVILGITLFGGLFGLVGLFLGPPLMAICIELLNEIIRNREERIRKVKILNKGKEKGIIAQIKDSVKSESSEKVDDLGDLKD